MGVCVCEWCQFFALELTFQNAYLEERLSDVCSKNKFAVSKLQEQLQEFRTQLDAFIELVVERRFTVFMRRGFEYDTDLCSHGLSSDYRMTRPVVDSVSKKC